MASIDERAEFEEHVAWFTGFMGKNETYQKALEDLYKDAYNEAAPKSVIRLPVSLPDLEQAEDRLSWKILQNPSKYIQAFEEGLQRWACQPESKMNKFQKSMVPIRIAFTGAAGRHHMTPRGLTAGFVTKLVVVEGIVTRTGLSKPHLLLSVHFCNATGETRTREHPDPCALKFQSISGEAPKVDENNNKFAAEMGLSHYKDVLTFNIQEMPETAPSGQIPRSVEVRCDLELVDIPRPGARVRVTGMYKAFPNTDTRGITNGHFPCRIVANNVQLIKEEVNKEVITAKDMATCRQIAARDDCIELLTRSMAPSICGHEAVKRGLLLLLSGGAEKNLKNGTHLRGDINVLLVGDPSCGKSQMLRFIMNTAKLTVSTTGRGSSGVGLTASVNIDRRSGEKRLEAGAMVLADRGIVCIDEFDKMGVNDRVAIHEVMEQQTVTIAKAGIHTTLNARCSVLAAANPLYSNFDDSLGLTQNLNLPDSLLSRFDLIFIVRDLNTTDIDRKIATQVLSQARYVCMDGTGDVQDANEFHDAIYERAPEENKEQMKKDSEQVFEVRKFSDEDLLTVNFLKKYLTVIKRLDPPVLSEEASLKIGAFYVDLRQRVKNSPNPENELAVTVRSLESMIRIATAIAKLKMRTEVLEEDAILARKVVFEARGYDTSTEVGPNPMRDLNDDLDVEMRDADTDATSTKKTPSTEKLGLSDARRSEFQISVGKVFSETNEYFLLNSVVLEEVNKVQEKKRLRPFTQDEYELGKIDLISRNKMVVEDDHVYLVA